MSGAGDLRDRVHLQKRETVSDGMGSTLPGGAFVTQATVSANFKPLRGSETVMAARLQGQQPYVLRVRASSQSRQVDPSWRIVDARNQDRVFAITAPATDPDGKRAWLEFLITEGEPS